jgi:hypothetical protein
MRLPRPGVKMRAMRPPHMSSKKDAWDKAQIISGFISSIVIAGVGILINISIQRAQINASRSASDAQIAVTRSNNDAQLALAKENAETQKHVQESTITAQLMESLAAGTPLKKQIAIIALRRSVPSELYQDVVAIVLKSDEDPDVRRIAIQEAATFQGAPEVAAALAQIVQNPKRSTEERQTAQTTLGQLGLNSIAPNGSFSLFAAGSDQQALESVHQSGGLFTYYLLKGLSGAASKSLDGNMSLIDLAEYVRQSVSRASGGTQRPAYYDELPIHISFPVGPSTKFPKTIAVVIGNSKYSDAELNLLYSASDAEKVAELLTSKGATVFSIHNGTRLETLSTFTNALDKVTEDSLMIFYYAGHALADRTGNTWLVPVDFQPAPTLDSLSSTLISVTDVRDMLSRVRCRAAILFLDASTSSAAVAARPCGRIFDRLCFWDSSAGSGMIHRVPTESEAGVHVDKDG